MNRRELLGRVAALGSAGVLAGCLTSPGGGSGDGGDGGDGGGTPTPSVGDRTIETTDSGCGSGGEAAVAFDGDAVRVTGTIQAPDPCHRAKLLSATYDPDADRLSVSVGVVERTDVAACAQCIAGIEYEARITFSNGLPAEVAVDHDGEAVTTASR